MKKIPYTRILFGSVFVYGLAAIITLGVNWNASSWVEYKSTPSIVIHRKAFRMPHFHMKEGDTFSIQYNSKTLYLTTAKTIRSADISPNRITFTATDKTRHIVDL